MVNRIVGLFWSNDVHNPSMISFQGEIEFHTGSFEGTLNDQFGKSEIKGMRSEKVMMFNKEYIPSDPSYRGGAKETIRFIFRNRVGGWWGTYKIITAGAGERGHAICAFTQLSD